MLKQKEAVYSIVKSVLDTASVPFTEHETDVTPLLTKDLRKLISMELSNGLKAGEIELKKAFEEAKLVTYASSLLTNWLKKDCRLNGTPAKEPKPKKQKALKVKKTKEEAIRPCGHPTGPEEDCPHCEKAQEAQEQLEELATQDEVQLEAGEPDQPETTVPERVVRRRGRK